MPDTDFLKDYVQVKDRVVALYELFGQARIETTYEITREPDDKPKVIARALVYRNPEDTSPASVGTSWLYLPGTTNFTKGSEIENAETSAVGRAIGFLGILTDKGLASANEIAGHQEDAPAPAVTGEVEELVGTESREGTVKVGGAAGYKLEVHQGPEGPVFGFTLETAKGNIPQVLVEGDLAAAVIVAELGDPANLKGHWCRVKGRVYSVRQQGRAGYFRMRVTEFETREYKVPSEEAPSLPMFNESDQAEIDALPV